MIKVSVMYPDADGCRFDFDYYCKSHMPMVADKLGSACQGVAVDKYIPTSSGERPPFVAAAHLFFESVEAFRNAFAPHAEAILADVPNYTDLQPTLMFSEVLVNAKRGRTGELHLHLL